MSCFGPSEPECWRDEKAISIEQRRARYRCKDKFVTISQIQTWPEYLAAKKDAEKSGAETQAKKEAALPQPQTEEKKDEEGKEKEAKKEGIDFEGGKQEVDDLAMKREKKGGGGFQPDVKVKADPKINAKVSLWRGDTLISESGGGGIDGAIHNAAGEELFNECKMLPELPTDGQLKGVRCPEGQAKITRGYNLPALYVLHTVGPHGEDEKVLESAYKAVLAYAGKYKIKTIAFCGISTGIFGYPLYKASNVACRVVRKWLESSGNRNKVTRLIFCTYLEKEQECYEALMRIYFPVQ